MVAQLEAHRMTTTDLLQRLPALREMFPKEIQMEWPMAEYLIAYKEQEERTLAALDRWKAEVESRGGKQRMKTSFKTGQLWKSPTGVIVIFYVDEVRLTWVLFRTKDKTRGTYVWHMGPSALSGFVGLRRIA